MSGERRRVQLKINLPAELAQAVASVSRNARSMEEAVCRLLGRALRKSERPGAVLRTVVIATLLQKDRPRRKSHGLADVRTWLPTVPRRSLDKVLRELESEGVLRLIRPRSLTLDPRTRAAALFDPERGHLTRVSLAPLPRAVRAALVAGSSPEDGRNARVEAS